MKYSLNWLKELAGVSWPLPVLSEKLADLGFPIESVKTTGVSIPGVVTAKILSVEKHPNADRLSVTQVDDGSGPKTVVCGATNIAPNQIVPLAKPGAVLPNGMAIAVAKIRGVESSGMLCSERELGLSEAHAGIYQLPSDTQLGLTLDKVLGSDTILDLDIPPNRPDVLSHIGLAREISAVSGKAVKLPAVSWKAGTHGPACSIEIKDARCVRYTGKIIRGVTVGPSPDWLAKRLESCGIRPINNIVDVTNYVLLEWGHPLHAFDLAKLNGGKIIVREADSKETIEALDGNTYELQKGDLLIADGVGPVAIAGIMGGQRSGVGNGTTDILLESAVFDSATVLKTSRRLGLKSESSIRFEKGTDVETAALASVRAASLIHELAGGDFGRSSDVQKKKSTVKPISFSMERFNRLVGMEFKKDVVQSLLKKRNYGVKAAKLAWTLTPPAYRKDVQEDADVAEDILRTVGYGNVPELPLTGGRGSGSSPNEAYRFHEPLREVLKGWGLDEVMTTTLCDSRKAEHLGYSKSELVFLANPLSQEESALRPSLLVKLVEVARRNKNNQRDSLRIFEIGDRHAISNGAPVSKETLSVLLTGDFISAAWMRKAVPSNFYRIKGLLEGLANSLRFSVELKPGNGPGFLHPQKKFEVVVLGRSAGWAGVLHPAVLSNLDLPESTVAMELELPLPEPQSPKFRAFGKYPFVERDIAVIVPKSLLWSDIEKTVRQAAGPLLSHVAPFDVFVGGQLDADKKSVAFRFRLQLDDRTLTDADIQGAVEKIKSALSERCGAQFR